MTDSRPAPPITAAMVARSRTVGEPRWSPSGEWLAWVEVFDGRADVVVGPRDGSGPAVVATADFAVTPLGAYGGGAFCWAVDPGAGGGGGSGASAGDSSAEAGREVLVVAGVDGRLGVVAAEGGVLRVLAREGHAFAPAASSGGEVAFCLEREGACDVAVVPLDGSAWPLRVSNADYAWDPAWSPDGTRLAWHEWDLPNMPWDGSRVMLQERASGDVRLVAGGEGVGVGQPRFSPAGDALAFVSDATGFANLWVADADGSNPRLVLEEPHEHAEPSWGPGARSFAWSPDGTELAWNRNEDGFARLVIGQPGKRSARELSKGWHRGLDWGPGGIATVRSGAVTPTEIAVLAADGSARRSVARGPVGGFEATGVVEPRAVSWRSGNATVHGLLYRPAPPVNRDDDSAVPERTGGAGRASTADPPLLVHIHGGPTSQGVVEWNARIQYFVSRGWAVLVPNYRGSTGHGRAYAQALAGAWGARDVADVAAGIRHAGKQGWCDPDRVAVAGGSAGGLTVLLLCAHHGDLVRAGVSLFGVTDLFDLAVTTHRFESRYLDRLVGVLPDDAARYREHSPITHAAKIKVPVLVLQGSDDEVVPQAQAEALVEKMRAAGAPVEYHVYEGEKHGWRQLATVADELERTETFLRHRVLDLV